MYFETNTGKLISAMHQLSEGHRVLLHTISRVDEIRHNMDISRSMPEIRRLLGKTLEDLEDEVRIIKSMEQVLQTVCNEYDESESRIVTHLEEIKMLDTLQTLTENRIPEWINNLLV